MIRQFYDGYGEHFKCGDGSDFKYTPPQNSIVKKDEVLCKKDDCVRKNTPFEGIFSDLDTDDLVLIGLLIFLLYDGVDDYILLIILGIIFVMGLKDKKC